MITSIDWWCDMCQTIGNVTDSVDVKELAARVKKAHRKASPGCECVHPFYSRTGFTAQRQQDEANA